MSDGGTKNGGSNYQEKNNDKFRNVKPPRAGRGAGRGSSPSNGQMTTDETQWTVDLNLNQLRSYRDRVWKQLFRQIVANQREEEKSQRNGQEGGEEEDDEAISPRSSSSSSSPLVATLPTPNTQSSNNNDIINNAIEINGRLCDSVLRCYMDNPETAKQLWKSTLLPLAKKALFGPLDSNNNNNNKLQQETAEQSFQEVCEKSLEALMFVSGAHSRADLGYEIALTARKRAWSATVRGKLGRAYVQGKIQWARTRKNARATTSYISPGSVDVMLTDGLERSIESELGLQLKDFFPSSSSGGGGGGGGSGVNQGGYQSGGTNPGGKKTNGMGRSVQPGERQFSSLAPTSKAWKIPDRIRIQFTNDAMNGDSTGSDVSDG